MGEGFVGAITKRGRKGYSHDLNLMLLTPEYGPRVVLGALLTTAVLEPDNRIDDALCQGEACGRCLLSCPGDAIGDWLIDLEACRPHSSPYGYQFLQKYATNLIDVDSPEKRWDILRGTDTLMMWQSMLHGVGIYTGCTRCYDVCPAGEDYQRHLQEVQNEIPESTLSKKHQLSEMRQTASQGTRPTDFTHNLRWIGKLS